jgi:hypothetical protein
MLGEAVDGFLTSRGFQHLIPVAAKGHSEETADRGIVFHQHDGDGRVFWRWLVHGWGS